MKNKLILFYPNCTFSPTKFPESQWFTWSNLQGSEAHVLKHVDRAMILECDFFHFQILSSTFPFVSIILGTTLSNHSSILFVIAFS